MPNKHNGFSLIEVLIVISIIAVIAAIAVPAVKSYMLKARAQKTIAGVAPILDQMITYANLNGHFPIPPEINIPYDSGGQFGFHNKVDPAWVSEHFPDLTELWFNDNGIGGGGGCGQNGFLTAHFDVANFPGFDSLEFNCELYHINGTVVKNCYIYSTGEGRSIPNFIPGVGSYYSNSQYGSITHEYLSDELFGQSSCM